MNDIYPTFSFTEPWKSVGLVITSIGYILVEILWLTNYVAIPFLSLFLWQEFNRVETQFQELANSQCEDTEARFNTLVIHHGHITEVLEDINNYVQHFIFTSVFMTLPVTCAIIHSILSKSVNSEEVIVYSTGCVWALLCVGLRLLVDALVSSKAHGTLQYVWRLDKERFSGTGLQKMNLFVSRLTGDTIGYNIHGLFTITMPTLLGAHGHLQYVWRLDKEHFSGKGLQKMNLFVSRLTGDSIGYNIHGLFTITMPTLLGIVGTLVTYIIVVVQFKPPDTSCQCNMFRNLTEGDMR
ncbi:uncharacterized protein [Haliotis cracherodii]|uniref:uncharacterized protein n=1 Tax=Haliotis cracherodii TaxID=6455 RepID=UPI0039E9268F